MSKIRLPLWYRHAWWLPGIVSVLSVPLAVAALRPGSEQSFLLLAAVLCALPWSLVLLLLDFSGGFADRAAVVVCLGLVANLALLWVTTVLVRARYRGRRDIGAPALEG